MGQIIFTLLYGWVWMGLILIITPEKDPTADNVDFRMLCLSLLGFFLGALCGYLLIENYQWGGVKFGILLWSLAAYIGARRMK